MLNQTNHWATLVLLHFIRWLLLPRDVIFLWKITKLFAINRSIFQAPDNQKKTTFIRLLEDLFFLLCSLAWHCISFVYSIVTLKHEWSTLRPHRNTHTFPGFSVTHYWKMIWCVSDSLHAVRIIGSTNMLIVL